MVEEFVKNDVGIGIHRGEKQPLCWLDNKQDGHRLTIGFKDAQAESGVRLLEHVCGYKLFVYEVLQTNFDPVMKMKLQKIEEQNALGGVVLIPSHVRRLPYPLQSPTEYQRDLPLFRAQPFLHQSAAWLTLFHEIGHQRTLMLSRGEDVLLQLQARERINQHMAIWNRMGRIRTTRPTISNRERSRVTEAYYQPEIDGWIEAMAIAEKLQKLKLNPDGNLTREQVLEIVDSLLRSYRTELERIYGVPIRSNEGRVVNAVKKAYPV